MTSATIDTNQPRSTMATTTKTNDEPTPEPKPVFAPPPAIVIGTNLAHARRAALALGLDRSAAYDITAHPAPIQDQTIHTVKPAADRARQWDELTAAADKAGATLTPNATP